MNSIDLLLTHGLIVTQDNMRRIINDGGVAIRGDRIIDLGPTEDLLSRYSPEDTLDVTGCAVFPGLIDTHTHLFQTGVKGLGEDMAVQEWVNVVAAPTAVHIRPEEAYYFSLTGCLEHIHSGVTTVVDMSYPFPDFTVHGANIRAISDSGLRGRYSSIIADYGEFGLPLELLKPIDQSLAETSGLLEKYPADDRLAIWLAIGAPWVVTDEALKKTRAFAAKTGTFMSLHLNENNIDNELTQRRHGKNAVAYLDEIDFLGPDVLAIHCVVIDDADIELLARHDVKVAYNPVSNMYLGSGIAPVMKMARAGITISIGVDGAGSNNSQDMIESLKMAALLQKVGTCDASVVDAQTILDWATRDAAEVVGLKDDIGSIEIGKKADMFVLAPDSSKIVPVHDPVATLVYSSGEENVITTIANGKILMKDRIVQHLDEQDVLRRCQTAAIDLADRCGSNRKLTRAWRPSTKAVRLHPLKKERRSYL